MLQVEVLTSAGFLLSIPVAVVGAKVADWLLDNCPVSASTVRKAYDVLSECLSLSLSHTHTHTHARTHARTHAHTHTHTHKEVRKLETGFR